MKNIIILIAFLLVLPFAGQAQEHAHGDWCGTQISDEWMQAFYQRDKSHLTNKSGNFPTVYIPIVYHAVGTDNGSGYFELNEIFRSHCELQSLYDGADIIFYIKDIQYINNSNNYNGSSTYGLFQDYNDPNACNVYFVSQMSGVCGYSFVPENWDGSGWSGPNRGGIMLAMNCMEAENSTYRHEMGHYLNLPHTFYGWEGENPPAIATNAPTTINGTPVERVDQSNCYAAGDGFCDTPPDYLSERWSCNFVREYRDPTGQIFAVDEKNYMSYAGDACISYLKDEQLAEVNAAPANYRPYLLNDPIPVIQSMVQSNGLVPAPNTANLNSNEIVLSWERNASATYYQVQATRFNFTNPTIDEVVTDTFYVINNAAVGDQYQWRVKPINFTDVCTPFTPAQNFSVSTLSADIDVTNSSCLQNADGRIEITVDQFGSYNYYWGCADPFIDANIQNINSRILENLSPETYTITVVSSGGDTLFSQVNVVAPDEIAIEISQLGNELVANITGGTPPFSYIWNNGSENLTLSNITSGEYSLIVIDQNGCQKTAAATFDEAATSIRDVNNDLIGNILIAPNPSSNGMVKVLIPMTEAGELNLSVFDLSGKQLNLKTLTAKEGLNTAEFDLSSLSKGVYIINAQSAQAAQSAKLVIR